MNSTQTLTKLQKKANKMMRQFYKNGEGLRSVPLKNYTSGDGGNLGMEGALESIIWTIVKELGVEGRVEVNGEYFNPPEDEKEIHDPQRLDHHIWFDDKAILLIESRAWIDKPFYTLKRAVIRNFMELDYIKKHLDEDVEFLIAGLAIDIKDRLVNTLDKTMEYGERISQIKFSPYRRGYKKKNYFDFGHNEESVNKFVEIVYNKINNKIRKDTTGI